MKETLTLEVCGGCNAKIGAGSLDKILKKIDTPKREDCIVGFESKDDACVIRVNDQLSIIQTVDFFPTMVTDPYLFGQIAAANAMSDIYAMGGDVVSALNLVCFPEGEDLSILEEILKGGALKVKEAGGTIAGGHSIHDSKIKYGMSVMGYVNTQNIWKNNGAQLDDVLILTKPLGVSLIMSAKSVDMAKEEDYLKATKTMTMLNKTAKEVMEEFDVHGATDITGFGLLGHMDEFISDDFSVDIWSEEVEILPGAYEAALDFLFTAGGQKNRKFVGEKVKFCFDDFALEEVLFDPQTSGGLLFALEESEANQALKKLREKEIPAFKVGKVTKKQSHKMMVK